MDLVERSCTTASRHPWEIARFHFFREVCVRHGGARPGASWMDVGAGDGWFASQLIASVPEPSRFVCWDIHYGSDDLAQLGTQFPGFVEVTDVRPNGRFDILLLLDVLEHVEDDRSFLRDLVESFLAPCGTVVISVPAYQALFSQHDRFLRHFRRYSPRQARALIADSGLELVTQGGLFHSLLPFRALQVFAERRRPPAEHDDRSGLEDWKGGAALTGAIARLLRTEAALSLALGAKQRVLPGLSYWAVTQRAA